MIKLNIFSRFLQIQIRTDYLDSDKHDATVITGIAIKVNLPFYYIGI